MGRQVNALFDTKTIKKFCDDIHVTDVQRNAAKEWLKLLDNKKLEDETKNYFRFGQIILQDILGYNIKEIEFESDNVEFTFTDNNGKKVVCFEAKGTSTKDLFAPQHRTKKEQETPIKQTWDNMGRGYDYGICTNYQDFVLLSKDVGYYKYHKFSFLSVRDNEEKLKEFIGIFSKQRIVEKTFIKKLYEESVIAEREFTKEFYKLFHETRLMLIKEFSSNPDVSKQDAIHHAQIFLNRMIFMFFAEDHSFIPDRIFTNRILDVLKSTLISEHSKLVSDEISGLFKALDKGSKILGVFGFNGGLFDKETPSIIFFSDLKDPKFFDDVKQQSQLSKKTDVNETTKNILKKYGNSLNSIIKNLLIMDSFDFTSEVNVNILGHIFEQSISDLEELREQTTSKRKREGVYYTPEYITDYICRNTIIPYLSKSESNTVPDLVKEYASNIKELENKIRNIKILDPACGSGAFLIKSVDILLEIDNELDKYRPGNVMDQLGIEEFSKAKEVHNIIENSIYGVDINEESVEITKLSLFLKLAGPNRKLIGLSKNVKMGNSLVDDKNVDVKAFSWEEQFPEVMKFGGFDIVIGNPPYVRQERLTELKPFLEKTYQSYAGTADLYVYFLEKGITNVKDGGYFGVIVSNKWSKATYGRNLRNFLSRFKILKFIDFGDLPVFEDAITYPCILLIKKQSPEQNVIKVSKIDSLKFVDLHEKIEKLSFGLEQKNLDDNTWDFDNQEVKNIYIKIKNAGIPLQKYCNAKINRGLLTGLDKVYVIDGKKKEELEKKSSTSKEIIKPYLIGKQIKRYSYNWDDKYILLVKKGTEIEKYPAIFDYLKQFKSELDDRWDKGDWFSLRECAFYDDFLKPKIIYAHFAKRPQFTFDINNFHLNAKSYILPIDDKYLLGVLNSKVIAFYSQSICPYVQGAFYEYNKQYVNQFPIPDASESIKNRIRELVDNILELQNQNIEKKKIFYNRIKTEFNVDAISSKLTKFYTLNSSEFIAEIKKIDKKSDISLIKLDEWEKYFNIHKNEIMNLENKIECMDEEIDQIVYNLFKINDDEKKIIENTIHHTQSGTED